MTGAGLDPGQGLVSTSWLEMGRFIGLVARCSDRGAGES